MPGWSHEPTPVSDRLAEFASSIKNEEEPVNMFEMPSVALKNGIDKRARGREHTIMGKLQKTET